MAPQRKQTQIIVKYLNNPFSREKVHRKSEKCKRQAMLLITLTITELCMKNSTIHIISNSLLHREFYRIHTHTHTHTSLKTLFGKVDTRSIY